MRPEKYTSINRVVRQITIGAKITKVEKTQVEKVEAEKFIERDFGRFININLILE